MLHVPLETDGRGQHVTVLRHVANPFASCTLNVGEEGATITIRASELSTSTRGTCATVCILWLVATAAVEIDVDPAASTIAAVAMPIPKASATGGIVPTDTVAGGESLDPGEESIKATGPGTGNVAKTRLSILIDAGGETMEAKVGREISIVEVITKGVDVRLEGGDSISEFRILNSSQEDAASGTIVVMEIEFGLQSEEGGTPGQSGICRRRWPKRGSR